MKLFSRKISISFIFFLLFSILLISLSLPVKSRQTTSLQSRISKKVIRCHVIANSDSYRDQVLKGMVRDRVLSLLSEPLKACTSLEDARHILTSQKTAVKIQAEDLLRSHNCYEPVSVSFEETSFPVKVYGSFSFPAGTYEAYRIEIGSAKGKNWWCVLYPSLCLTEDAVSQAQASTKKAEELYRSSTCFSNPVSSLGAIQLKDALGTDDYESLLSDPDVSISYRSKILDSLCALFS